MSLADFDSMKRIVNEAILEFNKQDFERSYQLCVELMDQIPLQFLSGLSDVFLIKGLVQLHKGFPDEGKENLKKAGVLFPQNSQIPALLGFQYAQNGDFKKAYEKLRIAEKAKTDNPVIKDLRDYLYRLEKDRIPGVFFNSIPKSGTLSIWGALYRGLGVPKIFITNNVKSFKYEIIDPEQAKKVVRGNCVAQGHVAATNLNLFLLEKVGVRKVVVHVRDPRQAMLSWIHYIESLYVAGSFLVLDYPLCDNYFSLTCEEQIHCEEYFSKSFEKKIDQHIEHYYPMLIQWLSGWINAHENPKCSLKIKFTYFENFKSNPENFYTQVLSFFDIDRSEFDMTDSNLQRKSHFRSGAVNEFRSILTPAQLERLNIMTPDRIFDRFQWRK
ncbi:MAG: hypothetical protein GXP56_14605 [Deltaproteobacteria bacterium]|nr:hypothetical protein [Deltaproteobacteria bacterium]